MARADMLGTLINWWESDSIAIICVTPFLIVHVAARLDSWMCGTPGPKGDSSERRDSTVRILESVAQFSCIIAAVYLVSVSLLPLASNRCIFCSSRWSGLPYAVAYQARYSQGLPPALELFSKRTTFTHTGKVYRACNCHADPWFDSSLTRSGGL
jgi:hypothetical protein